MALLKAMLHHWEDPNYVQSLSSIEAVGLLESSFLFSLVWSIGNCVDPEGRVQFDAFLREVCRETNHKLSNHFPTAGLVYDYTVFDSRAGFEPWQVRVFDLQVKVFLKIRTYLHAPFQNLIDPYFDIKKDALFHDIVVC
jgi:hypothetical protein